MTLREITKKQDGDVNMCLYASACSRFSTPSSICCRKTSATCSEKQSVSSEAAQISDGEHLLESESETIPQLSVSKENYFPQMIIEGSSYLTLNFQHINTSTLPVCFVGESQQFALNINPIIHRVVRRNVTAVDV